ncbi:transposase [Desulfobacterales bacterium HSG17]|nr:transposase [Desulfobacterales bacterium HSG17]
MLNYRKPSCGYAEYNGQFADKSNAVPGILAIVHTFGGDLKFNPHVHMLITDRDSGGLLKP